MAHVICKKPFIGPNGIPHGCGQCIPCRVNNRRLKKSRIMLEQRCHKASCFVTLTYADEHLPEGGTLVRRHTQLFLKSLRERFPNPIRYFGVGEYGDLSQRPHYHIALFGIDCINADQRAEVRRTKSKNEYSRFQSNCECLVCSRVRRSWGKGRISVDALEADSASYISGYVTKKMTNKNDPKVIEWLNGRLPEFPFYSLKPGIGALAVPEIVSTLEGKYGADIILNLGDVPSSLNLGKGKMPLGRYLKSKIIKELGYDESLLKKERIQKAQEAVSELHEEAQNHSEGSIRGYVHLKDQLQQKVKNFVSKINKHTKKGSL